MTFKSLQNHPKMDSKRCVQIPLKQAIPDTPKMDLKPLVRNANVAVE